MVILDHHDGYITWEQFLAIEAKLAADRTTTGARPPREGGALCQGIIFCGGCGRPMSTYSAGGHDYYDCAHARQDHTATPTCRSVRADTIDAAVSDCLWALSAVRNSPWRWPPPTRSPNDDRAPPAPVSWRWNVPSIKPTGPNGPWSLSNRRIVWWAAPTTSNRDRKRLLRTLIADVTLIPDVERAKLRIGIRWCSGSSEELLAQHMSRIHEIRCTAPEAIELARRIGPVHVVQRYLGHRSTEMTMRYANPQELHRPREKAQVVCRYRAWSASRCWAVNAA